MIPMESVELFKDITIYIDIVMSYIEKVSWMSKSGYSDIELLENLDKHFDEIECEFNGEEYITEGWDPKSAIIIFAWAVN